MKSIKEKIHDATGMLSSAANKFMGAVKLGHKEQVKFEYDLTANADGIWFTKKDIDDHIENFGGFVRKGKQRFTDYETLLNNVNVYNHKDTIHALCGSETNKALWIILMGALEQIKGTEVLVVDIKDYISLGGLISLLENEDITIEARKCIDDYLRILPAYLPGVSAKEQSDKTYEIHGGIAMDVWSAIMEQIES